MVKAVRRGNRGRGRQRAGIGGTLTITNDLGNSDVIMNDSANPDARTAILYHGNDISGDFTVISGLIPSYDIKLGRLDVKSLTISAGTGNNPFRIHDTLPAFYGRFQPTLTTVNTGKGSDTGTVAGTTGGTFYRATDTDSLEKIYGEINRLEKTAHTVQKFEHQDELYSWALIPAALLFGFGLLLQHTRFRRLP